MSWNDERVEQLRKMWMDGLSASQIAGELGNGITRNAVIGKVHRLGLSGRVKAASSAPSRPRIQQPRVPRNPTPRRPAGNGVHGNNAIAFNVRPAIAQKPIEDVIVPMCEPITIMELRDGLCRWPLGDPTTPEFRYCGGKSEIGVTYCPYHSRMAYQPAQDRRRERDRERRAEQQARLAG